MSHVRRVRRESGIHHDSESPDSYLSQSEIMYDEFGQAWVYDGSTVGVGMETTTSAEEEKLAERMEQLTPRQRFVIECSWGLRCEDGDMLSFREIGALMGIHWTTVKEHYDAAMKKLRKTPLQ